ncbi:MAG TPA: phosphate acetyltransferase, partial [Candidatus Omnitrophica bacterium]|nr:phosphate acetyltransferase [Candidatus Omnitrophota bacterium]
MEFIDKIHEGARKAGKKIILPEGETPRVLKAVESIIKKNLCLPVILGDPRKIRDISKEQGIDIDKAEIIDNRYGKQLDKYISLYCEIRKHKNIREDEAKKLISQSPVFYAALGVRAGDFDGFVAGSSTTTRDVAKAAIY